MATTYERLIDAGAPALTEPLFYRIKEDGLDYLVIEIRERGKFTGSSLRASAVVDLRTDDRRHMLGSIISVMHHLVGVVAFESAVRNAPNDE